MTETINLGLPFIAASQAQKHVTHNEALLMLDALVQLAVLDANRTSPPSSPIAGQRHIVALSPSGAWSGRAKQVAVWQDGAWSFLSPKAGWRAWSMLDEALLVYDGSVWRGLSTGSSVNPARLGINTTASAPNLLAVRSNAALFTALHAADAGSGDVRLQLSKESAANTASLVFSDAFSGRAEFGLTGDDDFHVKVSPDGSSWFEALRIARASGKVSFPAGSTPRETLNAARTYFVRNDGSDLNSGLANNAGAAFATLQKAIDTVAALDVGIHPVTIQLADGTYGGAVLKNVVGFATPGNCVIRGNAATPASVAIVPTAGDGFSADGLFTVWDLKDLKITAASGNCIMARNGATVRFGNLNFGACSLAHLFADTGANLVCLSSYAISGSAQFHWQVTNRAMVFAQLVTITLSGTPAFSAAFAFVGLMALVNCYGVSFSGTATGQRYNVFINSAIFTNSAGASFLPGNSAGSASSGSLYA